MSMVDVAPDNAREGKAPVALCRVVRNDFPAGHEVRLVVPDCPLCGREHVHPGGWAKRPLYGPRMADCCGFTPECSYLLTPVGGPVGGAA